MSNRIRYRLASWLLGYRPVPIVGGDGVYIVIREGEATSVTTARSIDMKYDTRPIDMTDLNVSVMADIIARRQRGTFAGTL